MGASQKALTKKLGMSYPDKLLGAFREKHGIHDRLKRMVELDAPQGFTPLSNLRVLLALRRSTSYTPKFAESPHQF